MALCCISTSTIRAYDHCSDLTSSDWMASSQVSTTHNQQNQQYLGSLSLKLHKEVLDMKLMCCAKGWQLNVDYRPATSSLNWCCNTMMSNFCSRFLKGKQWTRFVYL